MRINQKIKSWIFFDLEIDDASSFSLTKNVRQVKMQELRDAYQCSWYDMDTITYDCSERFGNNGVVLVMWEELMS